jgi:predicted transcriptional regulator
MRGRWASAAIGAGIARNRAGREMEAQEALTSVKWIR